MTQTNPQFSIDPSMEVDPTHVANTIGLVLNLLTHDQGVDPAATVADNLSPENAATPVTGQQEATNVAAPTEPVTTSPEGFVNPTVQKYPISSPFGPRGGGFHGGIDIGSPVGTTLVSAISGTVTHAANDDPGGYGSWIEVTGANGISTRYGHLSYIGAKVGQQVKAGQPIGKSGGAPGADGSGNSEGPHLHFEVRRGGTAIDPTSFLSGATQSQVTQGEMTPPTTTVTPGDPNQRLAAQAQNITDVATQDVTQGARAVTDMEQDIKTTTPGTMVSPKAAAGTPEGWIRAAMAATGVDESWFQPLLARMMQESGGRNIPQGIQDVNTAKGTPAFGPMQVIEPTFKAYMLKGHEDWHNPVDNTIAAIRYIMARYGHPSKLPGGGY